MVILGIDPGLNATGFGLIDSRDGQMRMVEAGVIRPASRQALGHRLLRLYGAVAEIARTHHPSMAVLEALYIHHTYLTTAALMAHARGVVCLAVAECGVPQVEYLPTRVKKALTGNGSASKEQVARMVATWLGTRDPVWSSDTTDALALAIAHAHIAQHHGPSSAAGVLPADASRIRNAPAGREIVEPASRGASPAGWRGPQPARKGRGQ